MLNQYELNSYIQDSMLSMRRFTRRYERICMPYSKPVDDNIHKIRNHPSKFMGFPMQKFGSQRKVRK